MDSQTSASGTTLLVVILIGGTLVSVGYLTAVMQRAGSDYRKTRDSLKPMRKAYWQSIWTTIKASALVAFALFLLIMWVIHDVRRR